MTRARMLWQTNLSVPLFVAAGNIFDAAQNVVVAGGTQVSVYRPLNNTYRLAATAAVNQTVLSLAVGLPIFASEIIFVGLADRIVAFAYRQGVLIQLWQTTPEPGANFTDIIPADLDGDGRQELAAIANGTDSLYVYLITGQTLTALRPELLAIRQLPGKPGSITAFRPPAARTDWLALSYSQSNQATTVQTLFLTETGFLEGPAIFNLPYMVTDLTAANLLPVVGEELAAAGSDGVVRLFAVDDRLRTVLVTKNLGSTVSTVTALNTQPDNAVLVAGTPGSYVFGFNSPGIADEPNWAFKAAGPLKDIAVINEQRIAVGTTNGILQIWLIQQV
ncbi:VCBS repeat-containing protein [Desulforamulus hydrothermalis]|uniref:FG-GAP repeat protein n=1 Tax=Desulforamulus hydrothermalis Lam5 = DSM 18033 TaxID=1121428 RepID=K8E7M9_9FIRM|nr:VCBS repeat-containing protein [Desulforamulus hydrothermalis]CCO07523.1 FG-GAP repeat protein [Desulforamulus hydrothermalis Lam5 = DSM 18033]SHH16561.1 hypothetical protein SAMN02745177_01666 [Desulforamulus hydrothermalis Lam5 = DSM 18033]